MYKEKGSIAVIKRAKGMIENLEKAPDRNNLFNLKQRLEHTRHLVAVCLDLDFEIEAKTYQERFRNLEEASLIKEMSAIQVLPIPGIEEAEIYLN